MDVSEYSPQGLKYEIISQLNIMKVTKTNKGPKSGRVGDKVEITKELLKK